MKPVQNITVFNDYQKFLVTFENSSFMEFNINADFFEDLKFC